jgi:hypothetical protein
MSRQEHIARTFVELADTLIEDFDVIDFLHQMTIRCQELLEVTQAAVFLTHLDSHLYSPAPCDPTPALQYLLDSACDQGPALEAYFGARTVASTGPADAAERWPQFSSQLERCGYSQATAIPMRLRRERLGSLLLLSTEGHPLGPDDLILAQALADVATIGLIQARTIRDQHTVQEQLHTALQERIILEQAKGVLAARSNTTLSSAFGAIRSHAGSHRLRLSEVAHDIINTDLTPEFLPTRPPDTRPAAG